MKMNDELWEELGFIKKDKVKLYQHNYFKGLTIRFIDARLLTLKEVAEITQKYISEYSYNQGRSYVQNGIIKALGLDYKLEEIRRCL